MSGHRAFYLDNEDGTGLCTVQKENLEKKGGRFLGEPKELEQIPEENWIKKIDKSITKSIEKASKDYWDGKHKKKSGVKGHGSVGHGLK